MKPGGPPDIYRSGQGFQAMRAKNRAKGVDSARYEDGARGGPRPSEAYTPKTTSLQGKVKSAKITEQPSNQDRYGANREAIKRIRPDFGRAIG